MIRRGFWFATGALAGIAGYRRASRVARTLLPRADLLAPAGRRLAGQGARRAPRPGGQPGGQQGLDRADLGSGRATPGQRAAAGTAAFVRDVRAGMADYLDQHRRM